MIFRDWVPVKNPNRLTEDEIRAWFRLYVTNLRMKMKLEDQIPQTMVLIQESDHDTESEQELSVEIEEEIEKESEITEEYFLGKDKTTTWNKNPLTSKYTKISKNNIVKIFPGLKSCAKYITDDKSAFEMFFYE
ncbi:hypothetical protein TNCT_548471 [Trichonephila clavata]|uniref:Uncharacterized protein n=1 Tax=Trichonephila clavata TaxID=2740835 RepID=A0A8X6LU67_TRICU|nr:hypothetical protein TNCT_548471 [Trichonephila clavata]